MNRSRRWRTLQAYVGIGALMLHLFAPFVHAQSQQAGNYGRSAFCGKFSPRLFSKLNVSGLSLALRELLSGQADSEKNDCQRCDGVDTDHLAGVPYQPVAIEIGSSAPLSVLLLPLSPHVRLFVLPQLRAPPHSSPIIA